MKQIEQEWKAKIKLVENNLEKQKAKTSGKKVNNENVLVKMDVNEKSDVENQKVKKSVEEQIDDKTSSNINVSHFTLMKIFTEMNVKERFKENLFLIEYLINRVGDLLTLKAKNYIKNENNEFEIVNSEREKFEFNQKYLNYRSKNESTLDSDDDDDGENVVKIVESKKSIPSFEKLKDEAKLEQLKIKEFYNPTLYHNEEEEQEQHQQKENYQKRPIILPEIDSVSQNQIREKIFLEKLIKNIENLFKFSNFNYQIVNIQLKNHIKNFISVLK